MPAHEAVDGRGLEGEPRGDAEVAAAAPQRPEQLGVRLGVHDQHVARGGDELDLAQDVDREPVRARASQPMPPPSASPPTPTSSVSPEVMPRPCGARVAATSPQWAPAPTCTRPSVPASSTSARPDEVDDESAVDGVGAVPAGADGDRDAGGDRGAHRLGDLGRGGRAHDRLGLALAGEHMAPGLVFGGAGRVHALRHPLTQFGDERHAGQSAEAPTSGEPRSGHDCSPAPTLRAGADRAAMPLLAARVRARRVDDPRARERALAPRRVPPRDAAVPAAISIFSSGSAPTSRRRATHFAGST